MRAPSDSARGGRQNRPQEHARRSPGVPTVSQSESRRNFDGDSESFVPCCANFEEHLTGEIL